ncbi:MAG: energy-coupling factor transporter transmembrane component T [Eubacteriales bacterium]|nr:energy-coupling factor transporter transmembrane component T [Eubacteriales bacterium]
MKMDPRAKLFLLLLANLMLFFHVDTRTEAVMAALFLLPLFFSGKIRTGLRFACVYVALLTIDIFVIPAASGILLNLLSMVSVGIRMLLPCMITGAYAFTTTTVGEFVCALRRMHVPESVIIPCMVVIRFFPTIREDYRQIRNAMAFRGIAEGKAAFLRHPAQSLEYILIPLLMNGNNVSQDLSVAALTKGIGLSGKHTCVTEIHMTIGDYVYMAVCTLPLAVFLLN